jgi:hypothetical protein
MWEGAETGVRSKNGGQRRSDRARRGGAVRAEMVAADRRCGCTHSGIWSPRVGPGQFNEELDHTTAWARPI